MVVIAVRTPLSVGKVYLVSRLTAVTFTRPSGGSPIVTCREVVFSDFTFSPSGAIFFLHDSQKFRVAQHGPRTKENDHAWLARQGLMDKAERIRPRELPSHFRALLPA